MKILSVSDAVFSKESRMWTVDFTIEVYESKTIVFTLEADDKSVLNKRIKEFKKDFSSSDYFAHTTVKEFGNYYFTEYKEKVTGSTFVTTYRTYKNNILPFIGSETMNSLTVERIQTMLIAVAEKSSASVVKSVHIIIEKIVNKYTSSNRKSVNFMHMVERPKSKKDSSKGFISVKDGSFTPEQLERITALLTGLDDYGELRYRYGYAILLVMNTGISNDEMLALTWDDVDWDNKTITITKKLVYNKDGKAGIWSVDYPKKKHANRTLPVTNEAFEVLKKLRELNEESKYVVCNEKGGLVNRTTVSHTLKKVFETAGIECKNCSPMDYLMDYIVNKLLDAGLENETVAYYLGLADTRGIEKYLEKRSKLAAIEHCKAVYN